jgi:hypothetical protein
MGKILSLSLGSVMPWLLAGVLAAVVAVFLYGVHIGKSSCYEAQERAQAHSAVSQSKAAAKEDAAVRASQTATEDRYKILIKRVPYVVKDDRACDLGPDAIGLLNGIR